MCKFFFERLWLFKIFTGPLFHSKICLLNTVLLSDFKAPQELQNLLSMTVLGKIHVGLVGMVNASVYKAKPIFAGLGHGKLS